MALPLLGKWEYGKQPSRKNYEIKLLQNGTLRWEGPHSRGGMLSGLLEEDEDGWYFAHLLTGQNEPIGSIRVRQHATRRDAIVSNFRSHSMGEWGSNIVAERESEEQPRRRPVFEAPAPEESLPLGPAASMGTAEVKLALKGYGVTKLERYESREQLVDLLETVESSLPLIGTWEQERNRKQYEIQHTEDGQLFYEGPHILGGTLVGVLYEEEGWLRAELLTCKEESELVGSVRVTHGPDWNEMTLSFKPSSSHWGAEVVARRLSEEHHPRRPRMLPADDRNEPEDEVESHYWESLEVLSQALRVEHAAAPPKERRANSWSRTLAFAQMTLGIRGYPMRSGSKEKPFVIWVIGATDEVEVSLAEQGFFRDVNWLDRASTKLYIIGENLLEHFVPEDQEKQVKRVDAPSNASVTKDDVASYVVVHPRVFVREQPSVDAKYVGDLFEGTEVRGREEDGWLRLDAASAELCTRVRQRHSGGPAWVLLHGRQLGLGAFLQKKLPSATQEAEHKGDPRLHPGIRTACYEEVPDLLENDPPDLISLLMPNFMRTDVEDPQQGYVPEEVLDLLPPEALVVFSSRFQLSQEKVLQEMGPDLVLPQTRCPFSAGAGDPNVHYDDNGWIFATRAAAVSRVLRHTPSPGMLKGSRTQKVKTLFWGIVDLKYDAFKPVLDRIQVLETGDGRISKFSGDGAPIQKTFETQYHLEEEDVELQTYNFISKDKKLTHDLFDVTGFAHIIPAQVCFPRVYYAGIASHISAELGLKENDLVVLKLCNRSRAAGVLISHVRELEDVLQDILEPPQDLEAWFRPRLQHLVHAAGDLVDKDSYEEHVRHWWANESPSFVAERCCFSMPTMSGGRAFDGTMRVGFALHRRTGASESLTPEDIQVDWLGGYWKLPQADMTSDHVRARLISQAKTGTAVVKRYILTEVYAALGPALQQLFGAAEFTPERLQEQYKSQPELAAYLIARRAMTMSTSEQRSRDLRDVEASLRRFTPSPARSCVASFVHRANGVLLARGSAPDRWKDAQEHFVKALESFPSNSNALFLLGMGALEMGFLESAVELMNKSLLLDPDFRAPYVNLGVAYLRQAAQSSENSQRLQDLYFRVIEVSESCLARHPASPQCHYHIGVASTQLALMLQAHAAHATNGDSLDSLRFREYRSRARAELEEARRSPEAHRRLSEWQEAQAKGKPKKQQAPWLAVDDKMLQAMEVDMMRGQTLKPIKLPDFIGLFVTPNKSIQDIRLLGALLWLSTATFQMSFRALARTSTKFLLVGGLTMPNTRRVKTVLCRSQWPLSAVPAMKTIGRTCCLLVVVSEAAAYGRSLRAPPPALVAVRTAELHKVCEACGDAGLNTLQKSSEYCDEMHDQCTCCLKAVKAKYSEICSKYMGFGGCINGIKAAIEDKDKECKEKQKIADALKDQQKQKIEDAVGSDIFDLHSAKDQGKIVDTPYKDECAAYNSPNCQDQEALCGFDSGCDRELWKWTSELQRVEDWQGMLDNIPCF
ncbi:unnamed protein product [Symbiodinium sp. CCMP2456]|nr:unnamed protein product [Symbiodinium sp. CCMP2456]